MVRVFKRLMILIIFVISFSYINVSAMQTYGEGSKCFNFNLDFGGFPVSSVTVNGNSWSSDDDYEYRTNDSNYEIVILAGKKGNEFPYISTAGGFDEYGVLDSRPNPNDDKNVDGDEYKFTLTLSNYNNSVNGSCSAFGVSIVEGPEPTVPFYDVDADITISISGSELEYHYVADKPDEADVTYFKFGINSEHSDDIVPFTFGNAKYTYIDGKEPPKNVSKAETKQPIHYQYKYNDSGYVEFCVNGGGTDEYTKIEINGVDYSDQAPHSQKDYFKRFAGGGSLQFCIKNVPYNASGYDVVVEGRGVSDDKIVAGFDWSYLSHDRSSDVSVENEGDFAHGKVEFVHAKYVDDENRVYEFSSASEFNAARYEGTGEIFQWADGNKEYPEENRRLAGGNVLTPYGTELTIRIVPDAGYQLTSLTTSEHGFQATDEPGVYKISLTKENLYFNEYGFKLEPVFTKIGSEVQATSNKVKGGSIETTQSLENGSFKLSVSDVNLNEERENAFIEKATTEGYEVSNIVDISLYNSIYKGGKKDNNGNYLSWDSEVNNLSNKANITLELEDDMSNKDIALIHEEHDNNGNVTGYTLVPVNYNSEDNTINFEEDNFSNFAIIVKDNGNDDGKPQDQNKEMVTVNFDSRGGTEMEPVDVEKGKKVSKPKDPANGDMDFGGWYTDESCTEEYDFNLVVTDNLTLFAKWQEARQKYNVTDENGNSITFEEIKNREYNLIIFDVLPMTDEELASLGATRAEYNVVKNNALKVTNQYGDLLAFYQIVVQDKEDEREIHEGPFEIKIKLTDEMKKYDKLMLIYLDDDFNNEDPIVLEVDGDYAIGTLPHLSAYTLVGTNTQNNPKTGDNINKYMIIFTISTVGLVATTIYMKKKVFN